MNPKLAERTEKLISDLELLRTRGDSARTALYWTVQRLRRSSKRSRAERLLTSQRRSLRLVG